MAANRNRSSTCVDLEGNGAMELEILSFGNGDPIPSDFALGAPADERHVTFGGNRSSHLRWSDVPEGTRFLAVIMHDSDSPTVPDDVNQEGQHGPARPTAGRLLPLGARRHPGVNYRAS